MIKTLATMIRGASTSRSNGAFNSVTANRLTVNQLVYCKDISVAPSDPELYISPTGSDTTGCGTEASPFATLGGAFDHLNRIHWQGNATILVDGAVDLGASPSFTVLPGVGQADTITIVGANLVSADATLAAPTVAAGDWTPITGGAALMMVTYSLVDDITVTRGDRLGEGLVWNQVDDTTVEVLQRQIAPIAVDTVIQHVVRSDSLTWTGTMRVNMLGGNEIYFRDVNLTHESDSGVMIHAPQSTVDILGSTISSDGASSVFSGYKLKLKQVQLISAEATLLSEDASPLPLFSIDNSRLQNISPVGGLVKGRGLYWTVPTTGSPHFDGAELRGVAVEGGILAEDSRIGERTTVDGLTTGVPLNLVGPNTLLGDEVGGTSLELLNSGGNGLHLESAVVTSDRVQGILAITDSATTGIVADSSRLYLLGNYPVVISNPGGDATFGVDSRDGSVVLIPNTGDGSSIANVGDDFAVNGVASTTALAGIKATAGPGASTDPDADGAVIYVI